MTREEWQRIKQLSMEALDLPEAERLAYVARVCAGDETAAREVRSLVASAERAAGLFEHATLATPDALAPGVVKVLPVKRLYPFTPQRRKDHPKGQRRERDQQPEQHEVMRSHTCS